MYYKLSPHDKKTSTVNSRCSAEKFLGKDTTTSLALTETNVGHLLLASDLLAAERLEKKCLKFLGEKLTIANCMKRLQLISSGGACGQIQQKWEKTYDKILLFIQMEFETLVTKIQLYAATNLRQFKVKPLNEYLTLTRFGPPQSLLWPHAF